jgi:hypothetical protein
MELTPLRALGATTALYILYKLLCLIRYYILGRRTGFPVFVTPACHKSILWLIVSPMLMPYAKHVLPEWLVIRLNVTVHGAEFMYRHGLITRMVGGNTFVMVSPDGCILMSVSSYLSLSLSLFIFSLIFFFFFMMIDRGC